MEKTFGSTHMISDMIRASLFFPSSPQPCDRMLLSKRMKLDVQGYPEYAWSITDSGETKPTLDDPSTDAVRPRQARALHAHNTRHSS
eukprot:6340903-Amphidinium_carterae.2